MSEKAGPSDKPNLSSMSSILELISSAFLIPQTPITPLPPPLLLIGGNLRPGMSAKTIAARIISRQSEAGAPSGDIFSKSSNIAEKMEVIRIQEIINELLVSGKIEIVIPPGVPVSTVGMAMGVPVISQGVTTSVASGYGIIR